MNAALLIASDSAERRAACLPESAFDFRVPLRAGATGADRARRPSVVAAKPAPDGRRAFGTAIEGAA